MIPSFHFSPDDYARRLRSDIETPATELNRHERKENWVIENEPRPALGDRGKSSVDTVDGLPPSA